VPKYVFFSQSYEYCHSPLLFIAWIPYRSVNVYFVASTVNMLLTERADTAMWLCYKNSLMKIQEAEEAHFLEQKMCIPSVRLIIGGICETLSTVLPTVHNVDTTVLLDKQYKITRNTSIPAPDCSIKILECSSEYRD